MYKYINQTYYGSILSQMHNYLIKLLKRKFNQTLNIYVKAISETSSNYVMFVRKKILTIIREKENRQEHGDTK